MKLLSIVIRPFPLEWAGGESGGGGAADMEFRESGRTGPLFLYTSAKSMSALLQRCGLWYTKHMREPKYAEIIVDIAHSNVDKIFDYALPEGMKVLPGCRVEVPFGSMRVEGFVLSLKEDTGWDREKIRPVLRVIDGEPIFTEEQRKLAAYMVAQYHTTLAFALRLMFPAKMRGERIREKTVRVIFLKDAARAEKEIAACYTKEGNVRAKNRLHTLQELKKGECPAAVLDGPSVRYLLKEGVAGEKQAEALRRPYEDVKPAPREEIQLSGQQRAAVESIVARVREKKRKTVLLHGVTGSGKTEVYIECVRQTLALSRTALILVPEISLAPQLFSEFTRHFGDQIAVFHSGLSDGEKYDEWRRVRSGQARIVMGARSAVFMPLENLGLIIIDEEHETSYKAENHPPYHAAEIARMRSHLSGATLVLASATPLVEDYMKARLGIYDLVRMPERVRGLLLPSMQIVDMKKEFLRGNRSLLSGSLYRAMEETLARGEQALVFLNRRGYASSVVCPTCGHVRMCAHCDVPLKYHKGENRLVCHYCGRSLPFSKTCPECGEPFSKLAGTGTEQAEEQIRKFFPGARTLRMDFDTTRKKDAHQQIYHAFKNHEADILIGTQMIARGLDFDDVTLAAVIAADGLLTSGDYRAEERTFSMIEQVGGRAGRKKPGRVIVQTYNPEHYAIQFAARHDYEGFYNQEIVFRKAAMKPPFSRVFRLVFTGKNEEKVEKVCRETENCLKDMLNPYKSAIILFIAKEAPVAKLDGNFRWHILLKVSHTKQTAEIQQAVFAAWERMRNKGVTIGFDVDPYDVN